MILYYLTLANSLTLFRQSVGKEEADALPLPPAVGSELSGIEVDPGKRYSILTYELERGAGPNGKYGVVFLDLQNGRVRTLPIYGYRHSIRWSPRGKELFLQTEEGKYCVFRRVDIPSGRIRVVARSRKWLYFDWWHDGRHIVISGAREGEVELRLVSGWQRVALWQMPAEEQVFDFLVASPDSPAFLVNGMDALYLARGGAKHMTKLYPKRIPSGLANALWLRLPEGGDRDPIAVIHTSEPAAELGYFQRLVLLSVHQPSEVRFVQEWISDYEFAHRLIPVVGSTSQFGQWSYWREERKTIVQLYEYPTRKPPVIISVPAELRLIALVR